jgi:hypothetical protein
MFQLNAYKRYTNVSCKGKTMDMDAKAYRLVINMFISTG